MTKTVLDGTSFHRSLRKKPAAYQHGDLAHALVMAGLAQLEVRGTDGVSLREAARAAGVSPMAAYHHFADKKALLTAIAAAGYAEFVRRQEHAVDGAHTPIDAILALGRCYVTSARQHPQLFRLMVGQGLAAGRGGPLHAELTRAFELACRVVALHRPDATRAEVCCLAASGWAQAHGLAGLIVDGVLEPEPLGFDLIDALVEKMLRIHWRIAARRRSR